jgi:hypothetical protein
MTKENAREAARFLWEKTAQLIFVAETEEGIFMTCLAKDYLGDADWIVEGFLPNGIHFVTDML